MLYMTDTIFVRFLATRNKGFTRQEISEKNQLAQGGGLTTMLRVLEQMLDALFDDITNSATE